MPDKLKKQLTVKLVFETQAENAIVMRAKEKFIESFNSMKPADQRRISKIMDNPKYLKGLADNELLLEEMFA